MSEIKKTTGSNTVAKAGLWYTVCNFLFKGMAFITSPIFARLLSKAELGDFSNLSSWLTILITLTALDLQTSIIRSKLEVEEDIESYIWSILSLTSVITLIAYGLSLLFPDQVSGFLSIDKKYIHLLFLYLLSTPAYSMLITKQRAFYKYKMFVVLTGICLVTSTLMSLLMVLIMEDKLAGRVYGYYVPQIIMALIIYVYIAVKGKRIQLKYWKYACAICLPLVPHVLSMHLLSSSDKILITRISGSEYTAVYSVAYSCYHIVTILFDSMNKAFAPWLLESLHHKNYAEIKKTSKIYIGIFIVLAIGLLMLVPEVIWILGGEKYEAANYCLPPLIASCVFQFIYTMYVNIEFYEKKTVGVAAATVVATAINIVLNLIFIPMSPENSYTIAAYTTLAGYMILFVLHYLLVKRMGMTHVYNTKFMVGILLTVLMISGIMNLLYSNHILIRIIRYAITLVYGGIVLFYMYKNKHMVLSIFRKKKKPAQSP